MTTHDRDKVIAAAKEAGCHFPLRSGFGDCRVPQFFYVEQLAHFYAIAHEDGRASRDAEIAELNNRLVTLGGIASTHVGEKEKLRKQVTLLRDLIPKRVPDGFVSFGKYYAEQESIFNPSYSEMTKFKNKYLSDCEEALAATEQK